MERPKIGALPGVIDAILDGDNTAPAKQRHTAKRVWQRRHVEPAALQIEQQLAPIVCALAGAIA